MSDISSMITKDLLSGIGEDECVNFIREQIRNPFDSGDSNYLSTLKDVVTPTALEDYCIEFIDDIEDVYPGLSFNLAESDKKMYNIITPPYKFLVQNIHRSMRMFIREYIFKTKNYKGLTAPYISSKISSYPKEQYGTKEFYVLITRLPSIIDDIFSSDIDLADIIKYIKRGDDIPGYVNKVSELLNDGILIDRDIASNIYETMKNSGEYPSILCKLQAEIAEYLITPYLDNNGLSGLRIPAVENTEDDITEEESEGEEIDE